MAGFRKRIKIYNEITDFSLIARRYFINNFYDGALTVLGILLGFFTIVLKDPTQPTIPSAYIILTGLGTAISMFISGVSGSYLSEKAEQKKSHADLDRAMGLQSKQEQDEKDRLKAEVELSKAMLKPIKIKPKVKVINEKVKSVHEKAESFAGKVVAIVNGGSPFLGGLIPLIPFFVTVEASAITFIMSFMIIFLCIVFLGIFLGKISKESILKNILQMLIAFILTMVIIVIFLG